MHHVVLCVGQHVLPLGESDQRPTNERQARYVEGDSDPHDAEFVIVGTYARWRDVIEGRLDPIKGMMEGKLKLARGHLPTIIRFVESSRRIVSSASRVPTLFVDGP